MSQPGKTAEKQTDKTHRPKPEPAVVTDPASDWTWLARFGGGPLAASGDGTIDGQAERIADPRLLTVQRQAIAVEIGDVQGNRHLHRVVTHSKPPTAAPASVHARSQPGHGVASKKTVQRQRGSITVGAAAEAPEEAHGELAREVIFQMRTNPGLSVRQALARALERRIHSVSPAIARSREPAIASSDDLGTRRASIIANSHYDPYDQDLDRAVDSAAGMHAELAARGYQTAVRYDLAREAMMAAWLDPLDVSEPGDKVFLFYHGHGTPEGLKDVRGQIFGMDRFGVLRERALSRWVDLTVILQACHTGSVTDYFRRQEIQSLRQHLSVLPSSEAARELLEIAEDIQRRKDEISALEARKQVLLDVSDAEFEADPGILDRRNAEADALNPQIRALWDEALPRLDYYQARVLALTGETLTVPAFPDDHWENFWTSPRQLSAMAAMVNRVLELAWGGG